MSAQAMADFLNMPVQYPVDVIAEALAELKESGEYDRVVPEAQADLLRPGERS